MQIVKINDRTARIETDSVLITDGQSALDIIASVRYETGCDRIIISKSAVDEAFFDLKTGIAGEVLQKFVNYRLTVAIVGDFSGYTSNSLKDFMYESNKGQSVFFAKDEQDALALMK